MPVMVTEIGAILYAFQHILCSVIWTLISISITSTLFYLKHMASLNKVLQHFCAGQRSMSVHSFFLTEYSRQLRLLLISNREIWSGVILDTLVSLIPANIYILAKVLTTPRGQSSLNVFIILVAQQACLLLPMCFLSKLSKSLHQFKKLIPTIQIRLPKRLLRPKIMYDSLHLRLTHGPKYGITIGSFSTITFRSTMRVVLFYVGQFIWVLSMYQKRRVQL